jgi:protein subunit release factor B
MDNRTRIKIEKDRERIAWLDLDIAVIRKELAQLKKRLKSRVAERRKLSTSDITWKRRRAAMIGHDYRTGKRAHPPEYKDKYLSNMLTSKVRAEIRRHRDELAYIAKHNGPRSSFLTTARCERRIKELRAELAKRTDF